MPLTTSNNLSLVQLVGGAANPEQTANDKGGELDSFLTAVKTYDFTSAGATVSSTDFVRYRKFKITNNSAGRTLTLQAISRMFVVDNSAGSDSTALSITLGSTTLTLASGKKALYETDGTANGLELILTNDTGGGGGLLAANNLSDVANAGTSRTNLGLGSIATFPETTTAQYLANTSGKALSTDKVWAAADLVALTDAATITVDMSTFINGSVTLAGNRTLGNPTNTKNGQTGFIKVVQDGSGSRTLAYQSNYKFAGGTAPVLSTAPAAVDLLFYQVLSSTFIYVTLIKDVR